ncbi:uncharacterized protein LOC6560797 [Drosophila grimshawi]|uniref:GH21087 n=1 Tax=Drosophila grimshawi TaxID=7222 RepID=B4J5V6_DROGR|nr:uncharacterized protein LOC6560797 [Drosophila grimshawi]EDW00799.1 GH21087 [Drosophila grimshawi]
MLRNLVKSLTTCSITKYKPFYLSNVKYFGSGKPPSNHDNNSPLECPETKTEICQPLSKRQCSPTDPPVRPCNEQDCSPNPQYSCCRDANIAKNICEMPVKAKPKPKQFVSMWPQPIKGKPMEYTMWNYPPECCPTCPDVPFDAMYYRPSDKCRQFQRTWSECCPRMVPKRICCWCDAIPPEVSRRCLPLCPRTACTPTHEKKRMECENRMSTGCPRITMPCCRAARVPGKCHLTRQRTFCEKVKCPFPSYSECDRMEPAVIMERPPECRCFQVVSACDANRHRFGPYWCPSIKCVDPFKL